MFKQPTIRQHYVQRKYLEPWCDEKGQLWAYRSDEKKYFQTTSENVFLEKGYYRLPPLNRQEFIFLSDLIEGKEAGVSVERMPIESIDDLLEAIIFLDTDGQKMLAGKKSPSLHALDIVLCVGSLVENENTIFISNDSQLAEALDKFGKIQMQILESFFCGVENTGFGAVCKLYQENTLSQEEVGDLLFYCGVQYFRTVFAGNVIEKLPAISDCVDLMKIRPVLQLIFGLKFADNLRLKTHSICVLNNTTSMNFLTGEQPIVNLLGNPSRETMDLELFYPITPNKALLIKPAADFEVFSEIVSDLERIKFLNRKIIENSNMMVSKNKKDIELCFEDLESKIDI